MGKATILSGGKDGLYKINVDYGDEKRWKLIANIDARIVQLNTNISTAQSAYDAQKSVVTSKESELDAAVIELNNALAIDPNGQYPELYKAITAKTNEVQVELKKLKPLLFDVNKLKAEKGNLEAKRTTYASLKLIETRDVWCADFTENATGQVATVEVIGEPTQVLIAPAGAAHQKTDGQVLARELMTPEQAYMNASLLPGWQKWKPTFRIGTIVDLKQTGATVNVRYEESSAQNLKINQTTSLQNVPIQYMDCNDTAFSVGDEVLIKFEGQDWKTPKIVGFAKEPKQCGSISFNGGVYRGWLTFDTGGDNKPNVTYRDTYFILKVPFKLSTDFWAAANNEIVCTFSNAYWGTIELGVEDTYQSFGSKYMQIMGNPLNSIYRYKTVYFNDGTPTQVYEQLRINMGTFWQNEDVYDYQAYGKLSPCNEPFLEIRIEESDLWGTLIAGHDISYWEAYHSVMLEWNMFFSIKGKVIFNGKIITYPQPLYVYPYGGNAYPPGVPGKYPLDDAYVCVYTGDRRPATAWKWQGGGIKIPPEVTWIQQI